MPESSNLQQNPDSHSEPDFTTSDSSSIPVGSEHRASDPSPSFEDTTRNTSPLTPGQSLTPASELEETSSNHIYQISPAKPDWSHYTLPPLENTPLEEEPDSGWKTTWAVVREVGETIILTLIIFFLIQTVIRNFRVVGTSMVDNLHDGQYLIIDKLSYNQFITGIFGSGGPQRGDVIVFEPPNRPGEDYVKRVIGLPGESIEIKNGQILINSQPLEEPFQPSTPSYNMPLRLIPEDQIFVLGDNRNNSNDSHNWGPLPTENIVGRAWLSYWPPERWGVIPRDAPTSEATLSHYLDQLVPGANAKNE